MRQVDEWYSLRRFSRYIALHCKKSTNWRRTKHPGCAKKGLFAIRLIVSSCTFRSSHRLNMELDLQSLFGLHVHSCTHWLSPRRPPTTFGLIYQIRRHLFVTPWLWLMEFLMESASYGVFVNNTKCLVDQIKPNVFPLFSQSLLA